MSRGDVVVSAVPGDYGKPRPCLVVQSDLFNPTHASVVICPITSFVTDAPLFRIPISPARENGLRNESQIMVDKIIAVKRDKIGKRIGRLSPDQIAQVDRALRLWLHLDTG